MLIAAALRALISLAILGGNVLFCSATPTQAPSAATCSERLPGGTPTAESYSDCTISPPWWTSYLSCPVTPIHTERYTGKVYPNELALYNIPWLQMDVPGLTVIAHLFYGNRPLHTDGEFPGGDYAKVLWQATPRILNLTLTATSLSNPTLAPIPITIISSAGVDWATYLVIPTPGCWRVDVGGKTEAGAQVSASAVFVVVE